MTWSIAAGGLDITRFETLTQVSVSADSFLGYDYVDIIGDAFAEWSRHANIDFTQITDRGGAAGKGAVADIRIFFGAIPGSTVGLGFYPSAYDAPIGGDILLDTYSSFRSDRDLFANVVLHEIGHALGLGHVGDGSIMTPTVRKIGLQQDDIEGIQAIYGVRHVLPSASPPLDATQSGDAKANILRGTATADIIEGGGGNDTLAGRGGDDMLRGQDGNDILRGHDGHDTLQGGNGDDWLRGHHGRDSLTSGAGNDVLEGGGSRDYVAGGDGRDHLRGGGGHDRLLGEAGDDTMIGGRGEDTLNGGSGNDALSGADGRDLLEGGSGNDILNGGGYGDVFLFRKGHGHDVVQDFKVASRKEKLDLSALDGFDDMRDVRAASSQQGADLRIDTGSESSILLLGVQLPELESSEFIF